MNGRFKKNPLCSHALKNQYTTLVASKKIGNSKFFTESIGSQSPGAFFVEPKLNLKKYLIVKSVLFLDTNRFNVKYGLANTTSLWSSVQQKGRILRTLYGIGIAGQVKL